MQGTGSSANPDILFYTGIVASPPLYSASQCSCRCAGQPCADTAECTPRHDPRAYEHRKKTRHHCNAIICNGAVASRTTMRTAGAARPRTAAISCVRASEDTSLVVTADTGSNSMIVVWGLRKPLSHDPKAPQQWNARDGPQPGRHDAGRLSNPGTEGYRRYSGITARSAEHEHHRDTHPQQGALEYSLSCS
jgi:hypothetical protein